MKTIVISCLCALLLASGCSMPGGKKKAKRGLTKTFYGRTIEYTFEPKAKAYLSKLETLLGRAHKIDPPLPDDLIVPAYRDADMNRDRFITLDEAKSFYDEFTLKFEDALGPVQYRASNDTF